MTDTDQNGGGAPESAKDDTSHVIGLLAVTLVVAMIFVSTLSPEPSDKSAAASHTTAQPAVAQQKADVPAPALEVSQTTAPLPAGHPNIAALQAAVQAKAQAPTPVAAPTPANTATSSSKSHDKAEDHEPHEIHWGYGRMGGPAQWGIMKREYLACGNGEQQSPIDIVVDNTVGSQVGEIVFNYKPSMLEVVNNGHTIQANYASGSNILVGGKTFELLQLHFHSPSEHQINNQHFDMEVHLVHKSADGELAVIGVMLKKGLKNRAVEAIWTNFPSAVNKPITVADATIDAADLLPADKKSFYHYMGSLTTPPCSEVVNWFVMQNFIGVTEQQVATLTEAVGENNRPVQPLNRRHVLANKGSL
ncbi:Carbonic anhydrase, alpha class [hydrothermal vent metagenome]|uniref:carbonic anhydrase n=1 Tax=hydrothermal vent metagenome TaxID=652676 RepID=A0A3B1AZ29_9ZZZZ